MGTRVYSTLTLLRYACECASLSLSVPGFLPTDTPLSASITGIASRKRKRTVIFIHNISTIDIRYSESAIFK